MVYIYSLIFGLKIIEISNYIYIYLTYPLYIWFIYLGLKIPRDLIWLDISVETIGIGIASSGSTACHMPQSRTWDSQRVES